MYRNVLVKKTGWSSFVVVGKLTRDHHGLSIKQVFELADRIGLSIGFSRLRNERDNSIYRSCAQILSSGIITISEFDVLSEFCPHLTQILAKHKHIQVSDLRIECFNQRFNSVEFVKAVMSHDYDE